MNAKQRRIAERIRDRALLDSDGKLQRIEASQRELAASRNEFEAYKAKCAEQIAGAMSEMDDKRLQFFQAQKLALSTWLADKNRVEDANIVREVLLQLELDQDPVEIALNIRKQFGFMIPEW